MCCDNGPAGVLSSVDHRTVDGGGSTNPAPGRYMYTKYVSGTKAAFVFRLTSNFSDQKAATLEKHSAHVHARILLICLHLFVYFEDA